MFRVVDSFSPLPTSLAVCAQESVKLLVKMDAFVAHVVVAIAELNGATFSVAHWPPAIAGVYMMCNSKRTTANPTAFIAWIKRWLLHYRYRVHL